MDYLYGKLNKTVKTVDSKIIYIPGEFNEVDILNLYDTKEDGIYRIDSGLHGAELIIINKEHSLFRRINGEGDYSYDFINHEWIGLEGDISSISIDGVEQPVVNKNVDLPAYPTKESLGLENVDNTSDATKKTNFTGSIADENTGFVTGGDAYTALSGKQATLVSGENIKTLNSNSLLGSGDIEIKSYRTFPASWTKDSTTRDFCQDIENDTSAEPGDIYFGTLECSDLPGNMIQAEATVEIISNGANGKCINITTTSLNTSPYRWNYSYGRVNGTITVVGWTGVQAEINVNNKLNASLVNGLATVATTGSYNDLSNKPSIPAAQIQSDWNQTNSSQKDYIKNKPTVDQIYNSSSERAQSGIAVATAVSGATESIQGYVANNYVAQENGKGLSTNDFTDAAKSKTNTLEIAATTLLSGEVIEILLGLLSEPFTGSTVINLDNSIAINDYKDKEYIDIILGLPIDGIPQVLSFKKSFIMSMGENRYSASYSCLITPWLNRDTANVNLSLTGDNSTWGPLTKLTLSGVEGSLVDEISTIVNSLATVATSGDYSDLTNTPDLSNYVPTSRTINSKALTSDITLDATDIEYSANTTVGQMLYNLSTDKQDKTAGISYLTTAPSSANTDGGLKFVVLSSEPATKYSGYIYFITSSQNNN